MSGRQSEEWEWTAALWQIKHFICRRLHVRIETLKREFGSSRLMFATLALPNAPRLAGWASKPSIRFWGLDRRVSLSLHRFSRKAWSNARPVALVVREKNWDMIIYIYIFIQMYIYCIYATLVQQDYFPQRHSVLSPLFIAWPHNKIAFS